MDVMVVGPPAPRSRLSFGGESQYIASLVFASSHISCIRSTDFQTEQDPFRRGVCRIGRNIIGVCERQEKHR